MPALGRRDAAKIVDDHLPLIRKLVWEFVKRHGDGVGYYELEAVAYEAARQAGETFNPNLGFAYATHCRKRIRFALIDYVGDRNRVVKDLEFRPKQYTAAWGDPDAEKKPWKGGRPVLLDEWFENGIRVRRYTPGPYKSNESLLRGNGTVTSRHGKVSFTPIRTQFADGWFKTSDGTTWKRPRIEDDGNPGVTDPRYVLWAGDKEHKGKEKPASADCSDWNRIWAANYREHRCGSEYQVRPWERVVEATPAALEAADQPKSYERADGATMIELAPHCYVSHAYLEGKAALPETARRQFAPTHYRPGLDDWLANYWAEKSGVAKDDQSTAYSYGSYHAVVSYSPIPCYASTRLDDGWFVAGRWEWTAEGAGRFVKNDNPPRLDAPVDAPRPSTGVRISEAQPSSIMDFDHFRENYYDPVQDVPAIGNIWETKPLKRILSDKHLVPVARDPALWRRPYFKTDMEMWKYINRWEREPQQGNYISLILKTSRSGRYKEREKDLAQAVPRPSTLSAGVLDGNQGDRRASSTVAQVEAVESILQLDILNPPTEAADRLPAGTIMLTESDHGRHA